MPTSRLLPFLAVLAAAAALAAPAQAQFQSCNYCDVNAFSPDPLPIYRCDTGTLTLRGIGYQSTAVNGCSQTPQTVVRSTRPDRLTVTAYRIRNDGRIDVDYSVPCNASPGIVGLDVTIDDNPSDAIVPYACGNARLIVAPICGDGTLDPGEQCDDGNTVNGDGCSDNCRIEVAPACGDGRLDPGEQCDDGNTVNGDGCDANCQIEAAPSCGNGRVDPGEQCDDGNTVPGDGCDADCRLETLSVNFISFRATRTADGVRVAWETAQERGTSFFEVRARLADGSERVAITSVEAGTYRYEAIDRSPEARAGRVSAYRVQEWTDSGPGDITPWFSLEAAPASVSTGAAGSRSR